MLKNINMGIFPTKIISGKDKNIDGNKYLAYLSWEIKYESKVPIYNAYNHHYFSWLQGADAEMFDLDEPTFLPNPTNTAFRTK